MRLSQEEDWKKLRKRVRRCYLRIFNIKPFKAMILIFILSVQFHYPEQQHAPEPEDHHIANDDQKEVADDDQQVAGEEQNLPPPELDLAEQHDEIEIQELRFGQKITMARY